MGCGSSSPEVLEAQSRSNGRATAVRSRGRPGTNHEDDLPTEVLPDSKPAPVKPPLAFEIPFNDDNEEEEGDGIVKKYPPRPPLRLQRLHPPEQTPTLEDLQEKLESAEKRRQQILQNRMASANRTGRQAAKMLNQEHQDMEEDGEHQDIKTPSTEAEEERYEKISSQVATH